MQRLRSATAVATKIRLLTWNLSHQTRQKRTPPELAPAILALRPDVVVLTEFVPGPSRSHFYHGLAAGGLEQQISTSTGRHNHVLIASKFSVEPGDIVAPPIAPSVPSNALHVRLPAIGLEVLGVRIPAFKSKAALRRACWDWLLETATTVKESPFVILGDLNTDPKYPKARCGNRIGMMVESGWQHAAPQSGASYWTPNGDEVRIDHAFASPRLTVRSASYVVEQVGYRYVGKAALSDHAALVVDVEL
jgi:endonuclease/exonuclease/phosphatase family metal-dependent hydrolase